MSDKSTSEILHTAKHGEVKAEVIEITGKYGKFLKGGFPFIPYVQDGENRRSRQGMLPELIAARAALDEVIDYISVHGKSNDDSSRNSDDDIEPATAAKEK